MGAASALVAFSRSLGGAVGVSVLGAVLSTQPDAAVAHAYGTGIGEIFEIAAPLGLVVLAALALMHERPLGRKSGIELARRERVPA